MAEQKETGGVVCIRHGTVKPTQEHLECPYCFGKTRAVVEGGDKRLFCDYKPGEDPLCFGFPEGTTRSEEG